MAETSPVGLLLSDDLIFTSRIVGTARKLGLNLVAARDGTRLVDLARKSLPRCVIIDLDNPGLELAKMIEVLSSLDARPRIVAYGPHVNAELLHSARVAGCDPVLPRSKFVDCLETDLPKWFSALTE